MQFISSILHTREYNRCVRSMLELRKHMLRMELIIPYISDSAVIVFFFFQAEDGIRDGRVTGVQTCALPISPNFSFRDPPCSFYSGSKALGEEAIAGVGQNYCWRLRIPFDEIDGPRNYLSKVQRYPKVYDNLNSISHRAEFVRACLDLWKRRAPFGIYNITNPGFVTTRQVVEMVRKILRLDRTFEFWKNDEEFYRVAAKTPRSNCVLDVSKLLATGVKIRPVEEALEASLREWKPETKNLVPFPA